MKLHEINVRDPFVYADEKSKKYYMYSSSPSSLPNGFCVYTSTDLEEWSEPQVVFEATAEFWATNDFWAPEIHKYGDKFYLFGTFSSDKKSRTSQILVADSLLGPFTVHSKPLAPREWYALDATLYVENETPYAIFSHEWLQIKDGEMCVVELSKDLSMPVAETKVLFKASEAKWTKSPKWHKGDEPIYVVDAPYVFEIDNVKFMLWSSWSTVEQDGYSVGVVYPQKDCGILDGKYIHKLLKTPRNDCGHAMVFRDFDGKYRIALHENNSISGKEYAAIYYLKIMDEELVVYDEKDD